MQTEESSRFFSPNKNGPGVAEAGTCVISVLFDVAEESMQRSERVSVAISNYVSHLTAHL